MDPLEKEEFECFDETAAIIYGSSSSILPPDLPKESCEVDSKAWFVKTEPTSPVRDKTHVDQNLAGIQLECEPGLKRLFKAKVNSPAWEHEEEPSINPSGLPKEPCEADSKVWLVKTGAASPGWDVPEVVQDPAGIEWECEPSLKMLIKREVISPARDSQHVEEHEEESPPGLANNQATGSGQKGLPSDLQIHVHSLHKKLNASQCPHCQYNTSQKSILKTHIDLVHNKTRAFECAHCVHTTSQKSTVTIAPLMDNYFVGPVQTALDELQIFFQTPVPGEKEDSLLERATLASIEGFQTVDSRPFDKEFRSLLQETKHAPNQPDKLEIQLRTYTERTRVNRQNVTQVHTVQNIRSTTRLSTQAASFAALLSHRTWRHLLNFFFSCQTNRLWGQASARELRFKLPINPRALDSVVNFTAKNGPKRLVRAKALINTWANLSLPTIQPRVQSQEGAQVLADQGVVGEEGNPNSRVEAVCTALICDRGTFGPLLKKHVCPFCGAFKLVGRNITDTPFEAHDINDRQIQHMLKNTDANLLHAIAAAHNREMHAANGNIYTTLDNIETPQEVVLALNEMAWGLPVSRRQYYKTQAAALNAFELRCVDTMTTMRRDNIAQTSVTQAGTLHQLTTIFLPADLADFDLASPQDLEVDDEIVEFSGALRRLPFRLEDVERSKGNPTILTNAIDPFKKKTRFKYDRAVARGAPSTETEAGTSNSAEGGPSLNTRPRTQARFRKSNPLSATQVPVFIPKKGTLRPTQVGAVASGTGEHEVVHVVNAEWAIDPEASQAAKRVCTRLAGGRLGREEHLSLSGDIEKMQSNLCPRLILEILSRADCRAKTQGQLWIGVGIGGDSTLYPSRFQPTEAVLGVWDNAKSNPFSFRPFSVTDPCDWRCLGIKAILYDILFSPEVTDPLGVGYAAPFLHYPKIIYAPRNEVDAWDFEAIWISPNLLNTFYSGQLMVHGHRWLPFFHKESSTVVNWQIPEGDNLHRTVAWTLVHLTYPLIDVMEGSQFMDISGGVGYGIYSRTAGLVDFYNPSRKLIFVVSDQSVNTFVWRGDVIEVFHLDNHGTLVEGTLRLFDDDILYMLDLAATTKLNFQDNIDLAFLEVNTPTLPWAEVVEAASTLIARFPMRPEVIKTRDGDPLQEVTRITQLTDAQRRYIGNWEAQGEPDDFFGHGKPANCWDMQYTTRMQARSYPALRIGSWDNHAEVLLFSGMFRLNLGYTESSELVEKAKNPSNITFLEKAQYRRRAFEEYKKYQGLEDLILCRVAYNNSSAVWRDFITGSNGVKNISNDIGGLRMDWNWTNGARWMVSVSFTGVRTEINTNNTRALQDCDVLNWANKLYLEIGDNVNFPNFYIFLSWETASENWALYRYFISLDLNDVTTNDVSLVRWPSRLRRRRVLTMPHFLATGTLWFELGYNIVSKPSVNYTILWLPFIVNKNLDEISLETLAINPGVISDLATNRIMGRRWCTSKGTSGPSLTLDSLLTHDPYSSVSRLPSPFHLQIRRNMP